VSGLHFDDLAIVAAVAFGAPLLLGLVPGLRVPSVVLEIVAGIVLGPSVLGWVEVDTPVDVVALIGLAFLLLLAGLEIEFDQLRGRLLEVAGGGFALAFGIGLLLCYGLHAGGLVQAPFLTAVILSATSLAVVLPVLKDSGLIATPFGQVVIAGTSIADVATVVMLSLFFSEREGGLGSRLVLFGCFGLLCLAGAAAILAGGRVSRLSRALVMLQDTTAQIRVRGAFVLLLVFTLLAERLGLEAILGAFLSGAILKLVDRDRMMTHSHFHEKLGEAGFGIFVPVFFVASGVRFDGHALFSSGSTLARVPVLLAALLLIRGLPALLYRPLVGTRRAVAAGLLQATTLSFVIVATRIGMELGLLSRANGAALVAAALLSVVIYPVLALTLLRGEPEPLVPAGEHEPAAA
jgi:Kef-type K+ transport system membrane component KefB